MIQNLLLRDGLVQGISHINPTALNITLLQNILWSHDSSITLRESWLYQRCLFVQYYLRFGNQSFLFYLLETRWKCKSKSITFLFRIHMIHINNRKTHRMHILQYFTWRIRFSDFSVKCVFTMPHCQNIRRVFFGFAKTPLWSLHFMEIMYLNENTLCLV